MLPNCSLARFSRLALNKQNMTYPGFLTRRTQIDL
jgi:hypothetical protein